MVKRTQSVNQNDFMSLSECDDLLRYFTSDIYGILPQHRTMLLAMNFDCFGF